MKSTLQAALYEDASDFSDLVLKPIFNLGAELHVVASFLPSYVGKLVQDLVGDSKPNSRVSLLFVTSHASIQGKTEREWVSEFLLNESGNGAQVTEFLGKLSSLIKSGLFKVTFLVTQNATEVATGCVGFCEELGGERSSFVFRDKLPGDHNSPIEIATSWNNLESAELYKIVLENVQNTFFGEMPGTFRIGIDQTLASFEEILKYKWLLRPSRSPKLPKTKASLKTGKSQKSQKSNALTDQQFDFEDEVFDDAIEDLEISRFGRGSVEAILEGMARTGLDGEQFVTQVWGASDAEVFDELFDFPM